MVKVKVKIIKHRLLAYIRFNHPMVKVKAQVLIYHTHTTESFNHPMVKVKEVYEAFPNAYRVGFQPPYGES